MANINLRNFPEDFHSKAKAETALGGVTFKECVIKEVTEYLNKGDKKSLFRKLILRDSALCVKPKATS